MDWSGLVTDFDGTIATDGIIDEPTRDALLRLRSAQMKIFLVTGRYLSDFETLETPLELFDMVVAENGALLYDPHTHETQVLAPPPPLQLIDELTNYGVAPLSRGTCIVATREPYETVVLEVIKKMGVELQVIFNKGAVMILPSGVNKATGLLEALKRFNLSPEKLVGVGDAENDHAFLELCGLPVAVANALPAIKEKAGWVTTHAGGAGVVELIEAILNRNLQGVSREKEIV